ncbi:hypothetical protein [Croceiramulus getboli]|nr:hypothetical protein P8624_05020 [Flavobacteriaceae bacterium YJPT1-3]
MCCKQKLNALLLLTLTLGCWSCNKEDDTGPCDQRVQIDGQRYENGSSDFFTIMEAGLEGECLSISIVSAGCSGNDWSVALIDSGREEAGDPPQRALRLLLANPELCEAQVLRTYTFDMRSIQTSDELLLLLDGWEESIINSKE